MNQHEVITLLQANKAELRALGVETLSLFGSTARDEAVAGSDVDLAARFVGEARVGMLQFGRIERRLNELLDTSVDLVGEPARKPAMQSAIDRDRVIVF